MIAGLKTFDQSALNVSRGGAASGSGSLKFAAVAFSLSAIAAYGIGLSLNAPESHAPRSIMAPSVDNTEPASLYMASPLARATSPLARTADTVADTARPKETAPAIIKISYGPPTLENAPPVEKRISLEMGRKDTLVDMIADAGVNRTAAIRAIQSLKGLVDPRRLKPGQDVQLELLVPVNGRGETELTSLGVRTNFNTMAIARPNAKGGHSVETQSLNALPMTMFAHGAIEGSLYESALKANVPDSVIIDMIRIFSYEVDFEREIRPGDQFEVYYDRQISQEGDETDNGQISYASLTLRGKPIAYYHFTPKGDSGGDFFAATGKSAKRALMKTPIDGARLSSRFGKRRHPVLGYTRMHKGVDFAAGTGTPILAAGDGVVEMAKRNGSFGNYVRIRHNSTYKTSYAHLSRYARGMRKGKRVKQGTVIGYVGATGRVTGAHLHYEVLRNGRQVNPLNLKIPTGRSLKGKDLAKFSTQHKSVSADISTLKELDKGVTNRVASK